MNKNAPVQGLPLRSNFLWTASGNIIFALSQWGMIVAIAKLTSSFMLGQFALGIAISTPALKLANLQLRSVQASDARREYGFAEYLGLRWITTLVALFCIGAIAFWYPDQSTTTLVILAVAVTKSVECFSDIFYGLFQAHDRLDHVGLSMMLRGALSVATLAVVLYLTQDVFWGVIGLGAAWLALLLSFDARRGRRFLSVPGQWLQALRPRYNRTRQWRLVRLVFPLGIVMGLLSLNIHMPRYFVHSHLGVEQLGVYSAMAYMTVGIVTLADALGHAAVPKLSRLHAQRKIGTFRWLMVKLVACGVAVGLAGIGIAALAGSWILGIAYGAEYAGYGDVFVWLMAAGGATAVASVLTHAITSTRSFRVQVPMFALVAGSNALACIWLVPGYGLLGGAIAALIAAVVHVTFAGSALAYLLRPIAAAAPLPTRTWANRVEIQT